MKRQFKRIFGGTYREQDGSIAWYRGSFWICLSVTMYRIRKNITIAWYDVQIFYYKTKIRLKK